MMDASILLPPTGTPLTGIDFVKRLPCGDVEKTRRVSKCDLASPGPLGKGSLDQLKPSSNRYLVTCKEYPHTCTYYHTRPSKACCPWKLEIEILWQLAPLWAAVRPPAPGQSTVKTLAGSQATLL